MLGTWGNKVLDFYIQNNIWINALVLLYALMIFLGRSSYHRSARFLYAWYYEKYGKDAQSITKSALARMIEKGGNPPWDQVLSSYWFPLITPPDRFVFFFKNQQVLQRLFSKETLIKMLQPEEKKKG